MTLFPLYETLNTILLINFITKPYLKKVVNFRIEVKLFATYLCKISEFIINIIGRYDSGRHQLSILKNKKYSLAILLFAIQFCKRKHCQACVFVHIQSYTYFNKVCCCSYKCHLLPHNYDIRNQDNIISCALGSYLHSVKQKN